MAEDGQRQGRTESEAPRMLRDQRMEARSPIPGGEGRHIQKVEGLLNMIYRDKKDCDGHW